MPASRCEHEGGVEGGSSQQSSIGSLNSWVMGTSRRNLLGMLGWGLGWGLSNQATSTMPPSREPPRHGSTPKHMPQSPHNPPVLHVPAASISLKYNNCPRTLTPLYSTRTLNGLGNILLLLQYLTWKCCHVKRSSVLFCAPWNDLLHACNVSTQPQRDEVPGIIWIFPL